jgi:hypothetical protein
MSELCQQATFRFSFDHLVGAGNLQDVTLRNISSPARVILPITKENGLLAKRRRATKLLPLLKLPIRARPKSLNQQPKCRVERTARA